MLADTPTRSYAETVVLSRARFAALCTKALSVLRPAPEKIEYQNEFEYEYD